MSQRLLNKTKWLWCFLALHAGSFWGQSRSVTVKSPPSNPSTIEAQAKFFQDFFSVQLSPYKIEFGHVCEDPNTWEQRYEKKDFKNHRDMGKVRWGDKKGGYGEHYWDLNHAGHSDNDGHDGYDGDDGSYHESNHNDPYDEPSDNSPSYGSDDYEPGKSSYEESGRAKRHHPRIRVERKHQKQSETNEESKPQKTKRKNREELEAAATHHDEEYVDDEEEEEHYEKPKLRRHQYRKQDDHERKQHKKQEEEPHQQYRNEDENPNQQYRNKEEKQHQQYNNQEENQHTLNNQKPKEKNQFVLVVTQKDDSEKQKQQYQPQYATRLPELPQYLPKKQPELPQYLPQKPPEVPHYVPYEGGAGVRQHHQPEVSAATTVPRLFLEPTTGHVVDRATGQAYVLQPIATPKKYN